MFKLALRPLARQDIKSIWLYTYEQWGEMQADRYTRDMGVAIEGLLEHPKQGNPIDHIRKGYRLLHFKHHLIIYYLSSTSIDVARILGENMDAQRHL